ncbi:hypothetical protein [Pontibacter ruber]|uniref:Outer membrane protein beta-barrel domain-containing protein n=1 Tax=Pontibacter ruber TaxID=1343895 RepID=A0ABW5CXR9_9BACT|nr:hypothetical protein [Pontibacter ruber]
MKQLYDFLCRLSETLKGCRLQHSLLLFLLMATTPAWAQAQPDSLRAEALAQVREKSSPYKTAFGFRYAVNAGQENTVSLKHFIKRSAALEAQVTSLYEKHTYQGTLWYVMQPNIQQYGPVMPFLGVGAGAMLKLGDARSETSDLGTSFAGVGSVGVEFKPRNIPMSLAVDYKRTLVEEGDAFLYDRAERTHNYGAVLRFMLR